MKNYRAFINSLVLVEWTNEAEYIAVDNFEPDYYQLKKQLTAEELRELSLVISI